MSQTHCSVCGIAQGPFRRDLPKEGPYERVVTPNKPYCVDPVECMKRRDKLPVETR